LYFTEIISGKLRSMIGRAHSGLGSAEGQHCRQTTYQKHQSLHNRTHHHTKALAIAYFYAESLH
jgi:hypothetical protein